MSALLSADDLNDFISPGVACIKPATNLNAPEAENTGEVEIQLDSNGNPLEISQIDGKHTQLAPAQISLADCLACSGCITSAEEVLVAQHSHGELKKALDEQASKTFVVSVSPQARASLAHAYQVSIAHIDAALIEVFTARLGFSFVVGTGMGRKVSLIQEARETITKKSEGSDGPRLCSVCPGWVLYAEKTHPYALPYMSTVKSAQQITGTVLKQMVARQQGRQTSEVYHLSIMPCFDKKLEAARPDNAVDVDCVLTPKELVTLCEEMDIPVVSSGSSPDYERWAPAGWPQWSWSNDVGSASGGYGIDYLRATKEQMVADGHDAAQFSVATVEGKNSDVYELHLQYQGQKVASSAVVNGFRNIQNLVRKLKAPQKKSNPLAARRRARRKDEAAAVPQADPNGCDYVEIMACPSGCINGGGQIGSGDQKQWLEYVLGLYSSIDKYDARDHRAEVEAFFSEFCAEYGVAPASVTHTEFNEVEKVEVPLGTKW
ncbi:cytosolic Fe-S cluster assembly factor Nar1p [Diutina catenulata]